MRPLLLRFGVPAGCLACQPPAGRKTTASGGTVGDDGPLDGRSLRYLGPVPPVAGVAVGDRMREETPANESSPGSPSGLRARRGSGFPASLGDRAVVDAHTVLRVTTQRTCGEARTRRRTSWLRASLWYIYARALRASPGSRALRLHGIIGKEAPRAQGRTASNHWRSWRLPCPIACAAFPGPPPNRAVPLSEGYETSQTAVPPIPSPPGRRSRRRHPRVAHGL